MDVPARASPQSSTCQAETSARRCQRHNRVCRCARAGGQTREGEIQRVTVERRTAMTIAEQLADRILNTMIDAEIDSDTIFEALKMTLGAVASFAIDGL